jgi:hypothetical protein
MCLDLMNYRPVNRVHPTVENAPAQKDKANADQKQQGGTLLTSKKHPEVKPASGQESGEQKKRDAYDWISLGVGVLGLLGLWYYAYWAKVQAIANVNAANASRDAVGAANESAAAAKVSAQAAQRSNELVEEQMAPRLSFTQAFLEPLHVGRNVTVKASWTNIGKTVATRAGVGAIVKIAADPPREINLDTNASEPGDVAPLMPHPQTFTSDGPLTPLEYRDIQNGTEAVFFVGSMQWIDAISKQAIFGTFCMSQNIRVPFKTGLGSCKYPPRLLLNGQPTMIGGPPELK